MFFLLHLRIFRGGDIKKDADKYVEKARRQIVLEAAAVACANGVPWAEALSISEGAIMKASAKPKRLPRGQKRPRPWISVAVRTRPQRGMLGKESSKVFMTPAVNQRCCEDPPPTGDARRRKQQSFHDPSRESALLWGPALKEGCSAKKAAKFACHTVCRF